MRKFAESYPDREIVQQAAAQIPWFHNCTILDKVQDAEQRQWYIRVAIERKEYGSTKTNQYLSAQEEVLAELTRTKIQYSPSFEFSVVIS